MINWLECPPQIHVLGDIQNCIGQVKNIGVQDDPNNDIHKMEEDKIELPTETNLRTG